MNLKRQPPEMTFCEHRGVSTVAAVIAAALGVAAAAVAAMFFFSRMPAAASTSKPQDSWPKAVVDHAIWDLGMIESGEEFRHTFIIRNEGRQPLTLVEGPKQCACTVANLPKKPVPPGGKAEVSVSFTASVQKERMEEGYYSRVIRIFTNDPGNADMLLELRFTVCRRLLVVPETLSPSMDSSRTLTPERRTFDVLVSSERWNKFRLAVDRVSHKGIQCRIKSADKANLIHSAKGDGYRISITLPPDLSEGRFDGWVDLIGTPDAMAKSEDKKDAKTAKKSAKDSEPETLRIPIHGSVHGRMQLIHAKLDGDVVLRLGAIMQGQAVHETVLLKINDPERQLAVKRIENDPEFLRAKLSPYHTGANHAGLYRIELEIPADTPPCVFTSPCGLVRLHTDHPRLPVITLKVDFSIVAAESANR